MSRIPKFEKFPDLDQGYLKLENIFIQHDFVHVRNKHSRFKVILSSIVLSQQCCEVYFVSLTVAKPL